MIKIIRSIAIPVLAVLLLSGTSFSETIFKKDGSLVKCTIIKDSAGSVTVKTSDGRTETIQRNDIIRTVYTEMFMGQVYIRLTSGQVLDGFIVDEDQKTYTVRKNLYKPEEITIQRDKVMFVARTNPNELTGTPKNNGISLKWSQPIKAPSYYNIYIKKGTENFRLESKTDKTYCLLSGLENKTKYTIKVTAIDPAGVESLPSNEIEVFTKLPPKRPKNVTVTENPDKIVNGEPVKTVTWDPVEDDNGPVKKYRIYKKTVIEYKLIAETSSPNFDLPADVKESDIDVRSVDDNGTESELAVAAAREKQLIVEAAPLLLFPLGRFGEMYDMSPGVMATAYFSGLLDSGFQMGISAGYIYLESADNDIDTSTIIPLTLYAGYSYTLTDNLMLIPNVRGGISMISVDYSSRGESGTELMADRTREGFEPVASAGLILQHNLNSSISIRLGADVGAIIESGGSMPYAACYFGVTYTFENAGFGADVDPSVFEEGMSIELTPLLLFPLGRFGEMYNMSPGSLVSINVSNRLMQNLNFSFSAGYVSLESADADIDKSTMVPLLAGVSYSIRFADELSIAPCIKAGMAMIEVEYESRGESGIELNKSRTKTGNEPLFSGGLILQHDITRSIVLKTGIDFGMIYEQSHPLGYGAYTFSAGYKF